MILFVKTPNYFNKSRLFSIYFNNYALYNIC